MDDSELPIKLKSENDHDPEHGMLIRFTTSIGEFYYSIPYRKIIRNNELLFTPYRDFFNIKFPRTCTILKLDVHPPQDIVDFYKSLGLDREWVPMTLSALSYIKKEKARLSFADHAILSM